MEVHTHTHIKPIYKSRLAKYKYYANFMFHVDWTLKWLHLIIFASLSHINSSAYKFMDIISLILKPYIDISYAKHVSRNTHQMQSCFILCPGNRRMSSEILLRGGSSI